MFSHIHILPISFCIQFFRIPFFFEYIKDDLFTLYYKTFCNLTRSFYLWVITWLRCRKMCFTLDLKRQRNIINAKVVRYRRYPRVQINMNIEVGRLRALPLHYRVGYLHRLWMEYRRFHWILSLIFVTYFFYYQVSTSVTFWKCIFEIHDH